MTVSTAQFMYNQETRNFVAEKSDLGEFDQVFVDGQAKAGFVMESNRTGHKLAFTVTRVEVDQRENELRWWDLRSADGQFTATVFND
jgi:uncharacterized metal-binding protein YceD (DUF177 family)